MGRDPAAVFRWRAQYPDHPAVGKREDVRRPAFCAVDEFVEVKISSLGLEIPENATERGSGLHLLFRQIVHLTIAVIGDQ